MDKRSKTKAELAAVSRRVPGKKNVVQPETGSASGDLRDFQKRVLSAVLIANVTDISEIILNPDTKAVFRFMNTLMGEVIPALEDNGGEVSRINESGVMALYTSDIQGALVSAVTMCQRLIGLKNDSFNFSKFTAAICFGYVMTGVVGHGKTYTPLTLSEYTGLTQYLQTIAYRYGAHILISDSYARQIENFDKRFSSRFLGYVYQKRADSYERIYDVFDGDDPEQRGRKLKSRMMFEKGVNLFIDHRYEEARLHFVEIMKANRSDSAAKEYLYLCDECISGDISKKSRKHLLEW